jgi:DNA-binding MarR family transcriptional regulator
MSEAVDLGTLFELLVRVQVDLFDGVDERLRRELDLMMISLLPMRIVAAHPSCRVQEVADELGISVGGASKSVDRLERRGWCRRLSNPTDRRSSVLELTAEGHRLLAAANTVLDDEMRRRIAEPLGADLERFAGELRRLRSPR